VLSLPAAMVLRPLADAGSVSGVVEEGAAIDLALRWVGLSSAAGLNSPEDQTLGCRTATALPPHTSDPNTTLKA